MPGRSTSAALLAATCLVAAGLTAVLLRAGHTPASKTSPSGYWHTSGNRIVGANGDPVRIAGINWYGFETGDEIVHGLWARDYHGIVNDIANLGYNTIRLPFSNEMVEHPIVPSGISFSGSHGPINGDLKGLNALQDLRRIVDYATSIGLKVILDQHREEAGSSAEASGLWYTSTYTTRDWVDDWVTLARMFQGNPGVIGADLHNEPHTPPGAAYGQGATWGGGGPNDWVAAAERAGNAILAVEPHWLIIVEGIGENPVPSSGHLPPGESGRINATWWGGDLALARSHPVVLSVPHQLVYSAHDYGPSVSPQPWFNSTTTAATLRSFWDLEWGYLDSEGIAPVLVGEFGTGNGTGDVEDATPGSEGQWFQSLVAYLQDHPHMSWTYWALNGEDALALHDGNYDPNPASARKQSLLRSIQQPLPVHGETGPPSRTEATAHRRARG